MNETKKIINKKKIILGISIVVFILLAMSFIIALKNHNTGSTSSYKSLDNNAITLTSSKITTGGTYKITGQNSCLVINTTNSVELDLENATITCENGPAINVESAGKVNIILNGENKIISNTTQQLDGAIYSKDDLIFKGTGTLSITSNYDGIVSKDDLVINGGNYTINVEDDGIRGKDSITITDGVFNITAKGDGIKTTNEEDASKGYIDITGGTFNIESVNDAIQAVTNLNIKSGTFLIKTTGNASIDSSKGLKSGLLITIDEGKFDINTTDDAIHSNGNIVINKGEFTINSKDDALHADGMIEVNDGALNIIGAEGIEGTYVKINGGKINISASDDGINAGNKSSEYFATIEINGGNITINMGQGDTDGIDSNGDLYINGGTINVTGNSPFDYDKTAKYTGGTIIVNGETTNQITNQMMGGRQMGGNNQTLMFGRR